MEDGFHIWSETYDQQPLDIFQAQDEIATAIAEKFENMSTLIMKKKGQKMSLSLLKRKFQGTKNTKTHLVHGSVPN